MAAFGKTFLYAEDDDADAYLMARAFRKNCPKHQLLHVHDGCLAIQAIAVRQPDIVILDVKMPGSGGFEVLKWLRAQEAPVSDTPAILLSSSSRAKDIRQAHELGANGYLVKPSNHDQLATIVAALCSYITHCDGKPCGWFEFPGNQLVRA